MRVLFFIEILLLVCCQSEREVKTYKNYIASWSSDCRKILFYSDRNGNWDIFRINADGTELQQITHSPFNEREPSWHPQKNAYAFSSDSLGEQRIFIHDFDDDSNALLSVGSGGHTSPSWSHDGKHIAYLSEKDNQWSLLIQGVGDSTTVIAYSGNTYPGRPAWSPSGKEVIYSVAVDGIETLHLANLDGSLAKTYVPGFNSCGNAAISPDGTHIVFDAHSEDVLDSGDGKWEIYKMKISDRSIVRLTNNTKDDWGARWSPDGTKIAFLGAGLNNTGYELFVMNADGSGIVQLTSK